MSRLFGLVGYPLEHSFSPGYFKKKFDVEGVDAIYRVFPVSSIAALPEVLQQNPELEGLNVTIPYKEAIIPYLDDIDNAAKEVGAVNCIRIVDGQLTGYNTDIIGFQRSLQPLLQPGMDKALVLGSGGAAKAVCYVLDKLAIKSLTVSRKQQAGCITYKEVNEALLNEYRLIVNTTPLGMFPHIDTCPDLPYEVLTTEHLLYDLVYNPAETLFLQKGKQQGAAIKNGLEMLELQADASWNLWNL